MCEPPIVDAHILFCATRRHCVQGLREDDSNFRASRSGGCHSTGFEDQSVLSFGIAAAGVGDQQEIIGDDRLQILALDDPDLGYAMRQEMDFGYYFPGRGSGNWRRTEFIPFPVK